MCSADSKEFLVNFQNEQQKQKRLFRESAPQFNVFRMLGVEEYETTFHSPILADLLDPDGSHGQGEILLTEFLNMLVKHRILSNKKHSGYGYIVEREKSKIDINVHKPSACYIGIENKINHVETKGQLATYWQKICDKRDYDEPVLLFLTPTGVPSRFAESDTQYWPISYRDHIREWLDACLRHSLPASISGSLIQYKDTIRRIADMQSVFEGDDLARFLSEPDHLKAAYAIRDKIEATKTLLQGRFWVALRNRLRADVGTDGQSVDLTPNWKRDPSWNHTGITVSVPEPGSLKLVVAQDSGRLYLSVSWPEQRDDFESLLRRANIRTFRRELRSHYGTRLLQADKYQLDSMWTELNLRADETAEKLSHNVENVVSDAMVEDVKQFYHLCRPHLSRILI